MKTNFSLMGLVFSLMLAWAGLSQAASPWLSNDAFSRKQHESAQDIEPYYCRTRDMSGEWHFGYVDLVTLYLRDAVVTEQGPIVVADRREDITLCSYLDKNGIQKGSSSFEVLDSVQVHQVHGPYGLTSQGIYIRHPENQKRICLVMDEMYDPMSRVYPGQEQDGRCLVGDTGYPDYYLLRQNRSFLPSEL
ncbi:hypothetical protein [Parendozoicomonas haliclonae]|uniref:Uncharacterized protein n=1 Tax=Parendozoicomonas haliclonae TaxID=1960125 RepID=A0A1X7AL73_9GAMM|nr:hypothetical protein [Parendozoicomonas haliclonae]SMA47896.1 hypothetical protein EHSB41UT_02590 [Parendozoicomonas haliclonae]